ncbi:hypothetical protein GQ472_01720 [archaeon]|nr:hypothetical protein [archaeon]
MVRKFRSDAQRKAVMSKVKDNMNTGSKNISAITIVHDKVIMPISAVEERERLIADGYKVLETKGNVVYLYK